MASNIEAQTKLLVEIRMLAEKQTQAAWETYSVVRRLLTWVEVSAIVALIFAVIGLFS